MLIKLKETKLLININKYKFYMQEIKYLKLIVITKSIYINLVKIKIIIN